nr:recombinase family protein [Streptomyces sp. SID12488]
MESHIDTLAVARCRKIFASKKSGKTALRPELKACHAFLDPCDTLTVPSLDRFGHSLQDVINMFAELRERCVAFDDEARGALRVRGLWELLPDGDRVREAVDDHVDSAFAPGVVQPSAPDLVPSPHRLGSQRMQHQERPATEHRRNHQLPLVVLERNHSRMEGARSRGYRDHRRVVFRPLAP